VTKDYENSQKFINYFTSERIENVNITLEKRVTHNSLEYNTAPYQRDVYVITPLKSGSFSLGEAFFSIEGKVISYFSPVSKKVYPKRVRVLPLPKPIPKGFSGEVGKYQIFAELEKQRVAKGEGLGLTLTISGEGTGSLFQNPMKDYCLSSQPCPYTVSFLGEQKSSEFAQLSSGEYGSKSKSIFTYQLFPEKKGRIPAKAVKVIYFNPISKSYQTCQTMIPAFHVSAAMAVEEKVYQGSGKNIGYWVYALQILLVISGVVASFYYRSYLAKLLFWCLKQFDVRFYAKRPASILKVDEMIGRKKGLLLKNYLLEKGLNKAKVVELLMLKRRYENLTLLKIFQKSDNLQKDYLLKLTEELLKEEKI
ncbi:MAG: BatD family protein, partial [Spirochaetota bacterium]